LKNKKFSIFRKVNTSAWGQFFLIAQFESRMIQINSWD